MNNKQLQKKAKNLRAKSEKLVNKMLILKSSMLNGKISQKRFTKAYAKLERKWVNCLERN